MILDSTLDLWTEDFAAKSTYTFCLLVMNRILTLLLLLNGDKHGAPGWPSELSMWLELRSSYHGS